MIKAFLAAVLLALVPSAAFATLPSIQISDATCTEGGNCNFSVKLVGTKPSVGYKTVASAYSVNITAKAGTDYRSVSGTVTLTYAAPAATIVVTTYQNTKVDGTRTFNVKLSRDNQARCYDCVAIGTIKDDDVAPPVPPAPVPAPPLPPPNPSLSGAISAVALKTCDSLWKTPNWDAYVAANPTQNYPVLARVTAGLPYDVVYEPGGQQGGLVPNNYTGPFVLVVSPSAPYPLGGSEFDPTCFPPAPVTTGWVSAPLQDGSFARVKANDTDWDITGPGAGRPLVPGEIVAVYFNGWGYDADGMVSFAVLALSDKTSGRVRAVDLEGVAPVGTPPTLPVDWWVPGLVTANKTCTDPRQGHEGQPGVTQGGVYRAAMSAGSHMKLAAGVTGSSGSMWTIFGSGDQNAPATMAFTVVTGDCLTGQTPGSPMPMLIRRAGERG